MIVTVSTAFATLDVPPPGCEIEGRLGVDKLTDDRVNLDTEN